MSDQQEKVKARGTREQVFSGFAKRTSGGLTKDDLIQKPDGSIISKKASEASKLKFQNRSKTNVPELVEAYNKMVVDENQDDQCVQKPKPKVRRSKKSKE